MTNSTIFLSSFVEVLKYTHGDDGKMEKKAMIMIAVVVAFNDDDDDACGCIR